ncbi:HNH endonuclease, partial [Vibrio coralliilyticus]
GLAEIKKPQISDEQKNKLFINVALKHAIKCPECNGYLDIEKSVSYDHIVRVREGGFGNAENLQLTHPYCNHAVKN